MSGAGNQAQARFKRGAAAYSKDGSRYEIEDIEDGVVYCRLPNGAETDFPAEQLMTEAEWSARSDGRREKIYAKLAASKLFTTGAAGLNAASSAATVAKVVRLLPGIQDYAAVKAAGQILKDTGDGDLAAGLSTSKCRAVYEAAQPEVQAGIVAHALGIQPGVLVSAGQLGDNLMRAMLTKAIEENAADFQQFRAGRGR
jgi:hypothetical protein